MQLTHLFLSLYPNDLTPPLTPTLTPKTTTSFTNCFIIDWDDTLLPTTFLTTSTPAISQTQNLQELEQLLYVFFNKIQNIGDVFIVTNSQYRWVEFSCRQFIPNVWEWLQNYTIITARSDNEHVFPNNPFMWKYLSFKNCIEKHHKCLISFGDASNDLNVSQRICNENNLQLKFFKFIDRQPDVDMINRQLRSAIDLIDTLCCNEKEDVVVYMTKDGYREIKQSSQPQ